MKLGTTNCDHHEILICRSAIAALVASSAIGADGHAVTRWNSDDLVPPKAREFGHSALATVAAFSGIDETLFSISVQTQVTEEACDTAKVYGGIALLLRTDDLSQVANARSVANDFAAALGKPMEVQVEYGCTDSAEPSEHHFRTSRFLCVDDLVSASFLGVRIEVPLELVVPGHACYQLQGRFRRRKGRSFASRKLTIRGHLRGIKVGGRTNRMFVNATDLETKQVFGNHPILFDNKFRELLAQALANPSSSLQLALVVQQLDDGRSKPRIKYVVENVDLA